jgi:hypothetical protein
LPIIARTPAGCFRLFEKHVRKLVADTVTRTHPVNRLFVTGETRMTLSFREGSDTIAVPIKTKFGRLYFYLGQALEAVEEDDGRFRLRTRQYWYRIQDSPDLKTKALLRWEYDTETADDAYCRHHSQIKRDLPFGEGVLSLDDAHLPTGWVLMEEVIRFLIVELGHKPPCGKKWSAILKASERAFYEEFTGKRYKPSEL